MEYTHSDEEDESDEDDDSKCTEDGVTESELEVEMSPAKATHRGIEGTVV